jgi:hypothetical protein
VRACLDYHRAIQSQDFGDFIEWTAKSQAGQCSVAGDPHGTGSVRRSSWGLCFAQLKICILGKRYAVDKPDPSIQSNQRTDDDLGDGLPPGDHALEVAARSGIGPLSPLASEAWHGRAKPCVSCGQLVRREQEVCDHCEQDLSEKMIEKMRAHAGPWYVLEHVRPFPGVTLDRIIRQINRGVLTETSIVRGPSTDFQWRFAVETPGLCRYFGHCWCCHEEVSMEDTHCPACLSHLLFEKPRPKGTERPRSTKDLFDVSEIAHAPRRSAQRGGQLRELSAALNQVEPSVVDATRDHPPRIGPIPVTWLVALLLIATIAFLIWLTSVRTPDTKPSPVTTQSQPVHSRNGQ